MHPRWTGPLIGRDAHLASVVAQLSGTSVALLGPAGIGKTRLALAALEMLATQGVDTLRITATPSERPIPLLAFRPLLGDDGTDVVGAVHRALGIGPARPGAGDPVVLVDDAPFLDDASIAALSQLLDADRVRLLLTARSTDLVPPALAAVLRRDEVRRITIDALDADDMGRVVDALIDGPVDGRSRQVLVEASHGNPLLARELVDGARTSGSLVDRGGMWALTGALPSTLVLDDLVGARVASLDAEASAALDLIAIGGRLRVGVVVAATSLAALETLESAGLVVVSDVVDVAHPLYRDVIVNSMGALRRLRHQRHLAELAASIDNPSLDEVLQMAVWQMVSGAPVDAVTTLTAARRAHELGDNGLAGDLAHLSYRTSPSADAAILAAWCLCTTGRQHEGVALVEDALQRLDDPSTQAALVLRQAEERWWWAHDPAGGRRWLDDGVARLPDGPWLDLLRAQHGVFSALDGDAADARVIGETYIDHPIVWVRRTASIGYAFGLIADDRIDEAVAIADRAFADAASDPLQQLSGDPSVHVVTRLFAGLSGGDAEATLDLARHVYGVAVQQRSPQPRAWAALMLSLALLAHGRPLSAARSARESELLWVDLQLPGLARWCANALGLAQVALGDETAAREVLERLEGYTVAGFAMNVSHEARLRAALRGDVASLVDTARREAGRGSIVAAIECLHDAAGLGHDVRATLDEVVGRRSLGRLTETLAASIVADRGDHVALASVAERFERIGRRLLAAESWALAARAALANGAKADGSRWSLRSTELLSHCEGARSDVVGEPLSSGLLSTRERDVARLVAQGLSNREVADRLVVSERTVESHLYRVFSKLGVSTRQELAAHLPS
jgi:DNA-binding CsgD family transcriptional regulator